MDGKIISHFKIVDQLGKGGMGSVYKAKDTLLDRYVALKIISGNVLSSPNSKARFLREAKAVAKLNHPNIAQVYEFGKTQEGQPFIAFEYLEGRPLSQLIKENTWSLQERIDIMVQVAEGLQMAHENSIVHRDLKPGNIIIQPDGTAKILDFGLAKVEGDPKLTKEGITLGTVQYMSPEQLHSADIDQRSDIFSFGTILFEMITGEAPFSGKFEQAVMYSILNEDHWSGVTDKADVPPSLVSIIDKALAKDPGQRYQNIEQMVGDLKKAASRFDSESMSAPGKDSNNPGQQLFGTFRNSKNSEAWQQIIPRWLAVRSRRILAVASFAILILAVLVVIFWQGSPVAGSNDALPDGISDSTSVLVTAFDNFTDRQYLGLAVQEGIVSALAQSEQVIVVGRSELRDALGRMELPDTTIITRDIGQEIGVRESYPVIISGGVSSIGSAYQVSVRIIETATGKELAHLRETAATDDDIINATDKLSQRLREELGESLASIHQTKPLPKRITPSLEALKLYARSGDYFTRGEYQEVVTLLEQAVEHDSTFYVAYSGLAIAYNNMRQHEKASYYRDHACRHLDGLTESELYMAKAKCTSGLDSTAYYYELYLRLHPKSHQKNNLANIYVSMGRIDEALDLYYQNLQEHPNDVIPHLKVARMARKIGDEQLADSVVTLMQQRFPDSYELYNNEVGNAIRFRHLDHADSLAEKMATQTDTKIRNAGEFFKLFLAGMRGKLNHTLAGADSMSTVAFRSRGPAGVGAFLRLAVATAIAAKEPDRALPALLAAEPELWSRGTGYGLSDLEVLASGYALAGNIKDAERVLTHIDSLREANDIRNSYGPKVPAVIAIKKGQPEEAINYLRSFRSQYPGLFDPLNMWIWGKAHYELGMLDEAAKAYNHILYNAKIGYYQYWEFYLGPLWPAAHEKLGYTYLASGDSAQAVRHLSTFVQLWEEADSDLQSRVEEARDALARLGQE